MTWIFKYYWYLYNLYDKRHTALYYLLFIFIMTIVYSVYSYCKNVELEVENRYFNDTTLNKSINTLKNNNTIIKKVLIRRELPKVILTDNTNYKKIDYKNSYNNNQADISLKTHILSKSEEVVNEIRFNYYSIDDIL